MTSSFTRNAVVLGLLSAVGPFAIDMYLPALPAISADLHATTSATQMTLIAFFVSFGLCQIVYGPLSDVYGRKLPLYGGLTLFILGAIGCALSPDVGLPSPSRSHSQRTRYAFAYFLAASRLGFRSPFSWPR